MLVVKACQPPVCRKCKHFKPNDMVYARFKYGYCTRLPSVDKVTGEPTFKHAKDERNDGACTAAGIYFEQENPIKIMIKEINWEDVMFRLMWALVVFMWLTTMLASYILSKKTF